MTLAELDKELRERYPRIYVGAIYYNSAEINWKDALKNMVHGSK
jgi:hypothetical protein